MNCSRSPRRNSENAFAPIIGEVIDAALMLITWPLRVSWKSSIPTATPTGVTGGPGTGASRRRVMPDTGYEIWLLSRTPTRVELVTGFVNVRVPVLNPLYDPSVGSVTALPARS